MMTLGGMGLNFGDLEGTEEKSLPAAPLLCYARAGDQSVSPAE